MGESIKEVKESKCYICVYRKMCHILKGYDKFCKEYIGPSILQHSHARNIFDSFAKCCENYKEKK